MKKNYFALVALLAASVFTAQVSATTTINLVNYSGTLVDNQWFEFGGTALHTSPPHETVNAAGDGSVFLSPVISGPGDASHIHVNGGGGTGSDATPFIHGDVGGVYIDGAGTLNTFSLQSMDVNHAVLQAVDANGVLIPHDNQTVTVRGYLGGVNGMQDGVISTAGSVYGETMRYEGGVQVASAIITEGDEGAAFNFLQADAGFGEVDYVEFFFTDFYRVKPSIFGDAALDFEFDNIVVGGVVSAVPVPAAVWLFGTGIMGLLSFGRRKQFGLVA